MNITDLSAGFALFATIVGSVVVYLKWRSGVIFVEPSIITDLQTQNMQLNADLDIERNHRRALENQIAKLNTTCGKKIDSLEKRIKELERKNGF